MAKHRITKVYTRAGDGGTTSLGGGQRVEKDHARIEAYGTVDELGASIGVAMACGLHESLDSRLQRIQSELFHVGSDLCVRSEDRKRWKIPTVAQRHVDRLESDLDTLSAELEPLEEFVLRGGTPTAAAIHYACTVCRRAERRVHALSKSEPIGEQVLPYLNRLSDLLFVMARFENRSAGQAEPQWDKSV